MALCGWFDQRSRANLNATRAIDVPLTLVLRLFRPAVSALEPNRYLSAPSIELGRRPARTQARNLHDALSVGKDHRCVLCKRLFRYSTSDERVGLLAGPARD